MLREQLEQDEATIAKGIATFREVGETLKRDPIENAPHHLPRGEEHRFEIAYHSAAIVRRMAEGV